MYHRRQIVYLFVEVVLPRFPTEIGVLKPLAKADQFRRRPGRLQSVPAAGISETSPL